MAVRERAPPRDETLNYLLFEFLGMDKKVLDKIFKGHQNINGIYEVLETDYGLQPITDIKHINYKQERFLVGVYLILTKKFLLMLNLKIL